MLEACRRLLKCRHVVAISVQHLVPYNYFNNYFIYYLDRQMLFITKRALLYLFCFITVSPNNFRSPLFWPTKSWKVKGTKIAFDGVNLRQTKTVMSLRKRGRRNCVTDEKCQMTKKEPQMSSVTWQNLNVIMKATSYTISVSKGSAIYAFYVLLSI